MVKKSVAKRGLNFRLWTSVILAFALVVSGVAIIRAGNVSNTQNITNFVKAQQITGLEAFTVPTVDQTVEYIGHIVPGATRANTQTTNYNSWNSDNFSLSNSDPFYLYYGSNLSASTRIGSELAKRANADPEVTGLSGEQLTKLIYKYNPAGRIMSSGSGTEADPYKITDAQEFAYFIRMLRYGNTQFLYFDPSGPISSSQVNDTWLKFNYATGNDLIDKVFRLDTDINLSGYEWTTPIMDFKGTFDGNGHKIDGLTVITNATNAAYVGSALFRFTGSDRYNAVIKNLSLTNVFIMAEGDLNIQTRSALISGSARAVTLDNCATDGFLLDLTSKTNSQNVGGMIEIMYDSKNSSISDPDYNNILNCTNSIHIVSSSNYLGGIVGNLSFSNWGVNYGKAFINIKDSVNNGSINHPDVITKFAAGKTAEDFAKTPYYVGGIVGAASSYPNMTIENCVNNADIAGKASIGGIVGRTYITRIISSKNYGNVTAYNTMGQSSDAGGIVGYLMDGYITGTADNNTLSQGNVCMVSPEDKVRNNANRVGGIVGYLEKNINHNYNKDSYGTPNDKFGTLVENDTDEVMRMSISYATCAGTAEANVLITGNGSVGGIAGQATYTDVYNCKNDKVTLRPYTSNIGGFIGSISNNNSIVNKIYNMENAATVTFDLSNCSSGIIGGIVGNSNGNFEFYDLTNNASIGTEASDGCMYIGGIIGTPAQTCNFRNCTNTASIKGKAYMGGIVGYSRDLNYSGTNIVDCTNSGDITVTTNGSVGGIIGYANYSGNVYQNFGLVDNCTFTGNITGSNTVNNNTIGGIAGGAHRTVFSNCSVKTQISQVIGSNVGGIVGWTSLAEINDCDAEVQLSGGEGVGGIVGYAQALTASGCTVKGSIVAGFDNFQELGINEWQKGGRYVGGFGGLVYNPRVKDCTAAVDVTTNGHGSEVGGFIGRAYMTADYYNSNYTKEGFDYVMPTDPADAFYLENCTVTNIDAYAPKVTNNARGNSVGGFVGLLCSVEVRNSSTTAPVTSIMSEVGGFVGRTSYVEITTKDALYNVINLYPSMTNCWATGSVTGKERVESNNAYYIGGFAGRINNGGSIENCYSTGDVTYFAGYVGGFIGELWGIGADNAKIKDCYTESTINITGAAGYIGGFVGSVSRANIPIEGCYSKVTLSGRASEYVGGFIGCITSYTYDDTSRYFYSFTDNYAHISAQVATSAGATSGLFLGGINFRNSNSQLPTNDMFSINVDSCYGYGNIDAGEIGRSQAFIGRVDYGGFLTKDNTASGLILDYQVNLNNSYTKSSTGGAVVLVGTFSSATLNNALSTDEYNVYEKRVNFEGEIVTAHYKIYKNKVVDYDAATQQLNTNIWAIPTDNANAGMPYLKKLETTRVYFYDLNTQGNYEKLSQVEGAADYVEIFRGGKTYAGGTLNYAELQNKLSPEKYLRYLVGFNTDKSASQGFGFADSSFTWTIPQGNQLSEISLFAIYGDSIQYTLSFVDETNTPLQESVITFYTDGNASSRFDFYKYGDNKSISVITTDNNKTFAHFNVMKDNVATTFSYSSMLNLGEILTQDFLKQYAVISETTRALTFQAVYDATYYYVHISTNGNGTASVTCDSTDPDVFFPAGEGVYKILITQANTLTLKVNFTPDAYYELDQITRNGQVMSGDYTFTAGNDNNVIKVMFTRVRYNVEITTECVKDGTTINDLDNLLNIASLGGGLDSLKVSVDSVMFAVNAGNIIANSKNQYKFSQWVIVNGDSTLDVTGANNTIKSFTANKEFLDAWLQQDKLIIKAIYKYQRTVGIYLDDMSADFGTITISILDPQGNKLSYDGRTPFYEVGCTITVLATAVENYSFKNYTVIAGSANEEVTTALYTFEVLDRDYNITAYFEKTKYLLNVKVVNSLGNELGDETANIDTAESNVSVLGYFVTLGDSILTITAGIDNEIDGYRLDGWYIVNSRGEEVFMIQGIFNLLVDADFLKEYAVNDEIEIFGRYIQQCDINVYVPNNFKGETERYTLYKEINGQYVELAANEYIFDYGTLLKLVAHEPEILKFLNFNGLIDEDIHEASNPREVILFMNGTRNVSLNYESADIALDIASDTSNAKGTFSVSGESIELNDMIIMSFNADAGYQMTSWKINDMEVKDFVDRINREVASAPGTQIAFYSDDTHTLTIKASEGWIEWYKANGGSLNSTVQTAMSSTYLGLLLGFGIAIPLLLLAMCVLLVMNSKKKTKLKIASQKDITQKARLNTTFVEDLVKDAKKDSEKKD